MEIKISREKFLKSISRVQSITERKTNMPILSNVLLTAVGTNLIISATDLELQFQETISTETIREGSLTISGRKLFEILKECKNETFHIQAKENNWVFISDGTAQFDLASLTADEFPSFIEPEEVTTIDVEGKIISEMISKTSYAVTLEEAGFKLSGVFTETTEVNGNHFFKMVATDGHRLSLIEKSIPDVELLNLKNGVMIPKKGLSELNKLASEGGVVQIGFKDKNCVIKKDAVILVIRLLETKFPDYRAIIPDTAKSSIKLKRSSLLESMRRMLILSNERYRAVKITLDEGFLELVSTNPDIGEAQEKIPVEYREERLEMGFNPRYFVETLQSMESEDILLGFIDNSKPCTLKGESDLGFLGLIMPMRL
ncbi:MAG: DNA polymerase III subunit beta [Desulfatiglans sp.]|jgi:DNA polymerase-3 subunit beta|nr:DNA polymerase III subunit beta [Desulfatiglans sp.]